MKLFCDVLYDAKAAVAPEVQRVFLEVLLVVITSEKRYLRTS